MAVKQIVPYPLWLGHVGEASDFRRLFDAGIRALVELAEEELPSQPPRELIYCRFPLLDGADNEHELLYLSIHTVANLLERALPTLVCCGTGLSRSPAVAAAAIALVYQEPAEEILKRIAEHHPSDVSPGLWSDITRFLASVRF
jgi:protein-tyrosine phosphatase